MGKITNLTENEHSYNEIMALYNKFYRTQYARLRAKTKKITRQELNDCSGRTRIARELTAEGKYSFDEFEKFLKGEESEIKIP
jgi:hypothetical protein